MKQTRQMRCYCAKKIILNKLIHITIIVNIMCSPFIVFHVAMLLLITKIGHTE